MSSTQVQVKPRKKSYLVNYKKSVYFAFKSDTETFLRKFEKEQTFNYADFANVWQATNFTFVFSDQSDVKPLKVLCDICFATVKKYITSETGPYIQIGAFYLLYGLYYKQPIRRLVRIRLTLAEYRRIKDLMNEMLSKGQYDALYIFAKMKSDEAFVFVAHPKPLSVSKMPFNLDMQEDDTFTSKGIESCLYQFEDILKDDTVQALDKTCKEYEAKLSEFAKLNPGLVPFQTTVIRDLEEAYQKVYMRESAVSEQEEPKTVVENLRLTRQSVRNRALANKNAQYRGSRKVISAVDLNNDRGSPD